MVRGLFWIFIDDFVITECFVLRNSIIVHWIFGEGQLVPTRLYHNLLLGNQERNIGTDARSGILIRLKILVI